MKILIFGDVHGNLPALEMMFLQEKNNFDFFICHGDIVNYGPWSNDCLNLLSIYNNGTLLLGNHEENYISGVYAGTHPIAKAFFEYCYPKFDKTLIPVINAFQKKIQVETFVIQHTLNNQYIFADSDISDINISTNYIFGHSHQQFERSKNNFKLYNTGSIGQNRALINLSCYLKLDTEKKTVELKNFVHDIDKVINQMEFEKYPQICIDYYKSKKRV